MHLPALAAAALAKRLRLRPLGHLDFGPTRLMPQLPVHSLQLAAGPPMRQPVPWQSLLVFTRLIVAVQPCL